MHKSSLKPLLALCVAVAGSAAFAVAPTLQNVPTIVISDIENNDSTLDNNLFVFTDAFNFTDLASDVEDDDQLLLWSFFVDSGNANNTGSITINGQSTLANIGDATTTATPINFTGAPFDSGNVIAGATILEDTLSPGGGAAAPHANPSSITAQQGAPSDVDNDGNADTLVGELEVTFIVADSDSLTDSSTTFVYTYDTTVPVSGGSNPGDDTIGGIDFTPVPLDDSNPGPPSQTTDGWFFRSWSDRFGGSGAFLENWLEDSTSAVTRGVQATLNMTGAGTGTVNGSFGASNAEWINPGNALADFVAGNVYAQRVTLSTTGTKTAVDEFRILLQENNTSVNQIYVVNADEAPDFGNGAVDHPFLPADGVDRSYLHMHDPFDGDAALTTGPYLIGYDQIDAAASGFYTAALSQFEIGSADQTSFNAGETPNVGGGAFGTGNGAFDGSDLTTYDGWREITNVPIPLIGGTTILKDPASNSVTAASIATTISTAAGTGASDIAFVEFSNFAGDADAGDGASDLDIIEVAADSTYRVDYTVQVNSGASDSNSPDFRLRVAYPIPTFSIEFAMAPNRGTAITAEDTDSVLPVYFTAATQFASSADPNIVGQENDLQLAFGPLDTGFTDGVLTLTGTRVQLLGADDPNIDY